MESHIYIIIVYIKQLEVNFLVLIFDFFKDWIKNDLSYAFQNIKNKIKRTIIKYNPLICFYYFKVIYDQVLE